MLTFEAKSEISSNCTFFWGFYSTMHCSICTHHSVQGGPKVIQSTYRADVWNIQIEVVRPKTYSPRKTYRKTLMADRRRLCCFQKLASCTTSSLPLFIILTRNLLVRHLQRREKTIENEAGNSSLLPNCPLPPFEIKICSTHISVRQRYIES